MCSRSALLFFLAAATVFSYAQDKSASEYARLVARVKAGDAVVDYKQMRLAYMESPEHKAAKNTDDEIGAMIGAVNGNDFAAALRNAEVVLANDYVDLDAHFAEYVAHTGLHHDAEAKLHKDIFEGLLQSITASGDGKSPATAFVVISSHEEYVLMRVAGLVPGKQILKTVNHHSFDIFEVTDEKSSQPVLLYFNIDIPIKHGE